MPSSQPLPNRTPWSWIPSLYFAEGIPYVVVMTLAGIMYKRLGVSNTDLALSTSSLYLPWVIKPLWSPLIEGLGARRRWIVVTQLLIGAGLAATAMAIVSDRMLAYTVVGLTFLAFSSATHDVAADGFYMLALDNHQQAWFVGIRNTAYRAAMIVGQGLLVMLAGWLESTTGLPVQHVEVRSVVSDVASTRATLGDDVLKPPALGDFDANDPLQVVTAQETYEVALGGLPAEEVGALKSAIRKWNEDHGFVAAAAVPNANAEPSAPQEQGRLETLLRRWFGDPPPAIVDDASRGSATVIWMQLNRPELAGEQLVVQFDRRRGSEDLLIGEGGRYEINAANAQHPFAALVIADPKLRTATTTTFEVRSGNLALAWSAVFYLAAGFFLLLGLYHAVRLPHPAGDSSTAKGRLAHGYWTAISAFFRKRRIVAILAFLLLYRFAEAQLTKISGPFLLDSREAGGLAMTTGEVGFVYGVYGVLMLLAGGLLGGFAAARHGLKRWLWPMALAINLPNLTYLALAVMQPESRWIVSTAVAIEQFGYGFGFTAFMVYCLYVAQGEHETVHYALCTGGMALGMMIPGMWSGLFADVLGYERFFMWIMIATLPSFLAVACIPLDSQFGKRGSA
ncbi:MAG: hypothetical protein KDA61_07895 [Planctomycetales bacterium]|nr:hypothetical protein [Planctomycetales bacterium]